MPKGQRNIATNKRKSKSGQTKSQNFIVIGLVALLFMLGGGLVWSHQTGNTLPVVGKAVSQFHQMDSTKSKTKVSDDKNSGVEKKVEEKSDKEAKRKAVQKSKAKLALIIDDFGYREDVISEYNQIDIPLTYAVIPYKPYSTEAANSGHEAGQDIIIHLPMESIGHANAEDNTITTAMSDAEINQIVDKAISSVPYAIGLNNHQGSQATVDSRVMTTVLKRIHRDGLYYIDSRTNSASVAFQTAEKLGVPTSSNQLFIDNSSDVGEIETAIQKGANIALKNGSAIIIGHARPNTVVAIRDMIKKLQDEGIEFVFVKDLL